MQAARRWGVIWPAALAGLVSGAAAGFLAAPDVIAVPGLFALSGMALGLLLGLLARVATRVGAGAAPSGGRRSARGRGAAAVAAGAAAAGRRPRPRLVFGSAAQRRPALLGRSGSGPSICGATGSG